MKKHLLFTMMALNSMSILAYDFEIDGICYNYDASSQTVSVTSRRPRYTGNIVIPSHVTYNNRTLKVTAIDGAFTGCTELQSVSIPNSIKTISGFTGCTNLKTILIPESVTTIYGGTFEGCTNLLSATLPNKLDIIREETFRDCENLRSISLPENLHSIYSNAFKGCSKLGAIRIPGKTTAIGDDAFEGCKNLDTLIFSNSLTTIELTTNYVDGPFHGCKLKVVYLNRPIKGHPYYYVVPINLQETEIVYINNSFYSNSLIFSRCESIKRIYSFYNNPENYPFTFSNSTYLNSTLYVPTGTKDKYIIAKEWKNFFDIQEMDIYEMWHSFGSTIDITTSDEGYSTFYDSKYAYALPKGLSAHVVTGVSNGKLQYNTIADGNTAGIIPKGTAVMLMSNSQNSATFSLEITESNTTYSVINLLCGSDEATTTTGLGYHYKLSYGKTNTSWNNVFGWYWGEQDGAPFPIEGHKAWLVIPHSAYIRSYDGFGIDGDATGVSATKIDEQVNDYYYDIQGRHINAHRITGLYIKNRKKIVTK